MFSSRTTAATTIAAAAAEAAEAAKAATMESENTGNALKITRAEEEEEERRRRWEEEDSEERELWGEATLRQEAFIEEPELSKEEEIALLEGEYKQALKQVCVCVGVCVICGLYSKNVIKIGQFEYFLSCW